MTDTWYAVIDANNNLISTGTVVADADTLTANGYSAITLTSDPTGQAWDPVNKVFNPAPAPQNSYPTWQWFARFTPQEIAAVRASTDVNVQAYLFQLSVTSQVVPQSAQVQQGLAYCVSIGLLTQDRATIIGAN
jgi:hypothetical protein